MFPGSDPAPRYRLGAVIGRGAMATVFRAEDVRAGAAGPVAVKRLHAAVAADGAARAALQQEAAVLDAVRHTALPGLREARDGERPFLAMELFGGANLRQRLDAGAFAGGLAPAAAGRLLAGAGAALDAIHAAGFVHGDVKPANILCRPDGGSGLVDLGSARPLRDALDPAINGPEPGGVARPSWGTPAYAAPALLAGAGGDDPRDDSFAFGILAYELLTGAHPFRDAGGSGATAPARPPGLGRAAWRVLAACLSPYRADRPDEAAALTVALRGGLPRLLRGWRH